MAQAPSFNSEIGSDTILFGNILEVRFTAENLEGSVQIPEFDKITVLAGPNISSSMQIINGTSTRSQSTSFILRPTEIGVTRIPAASFVTKDKIWKTDPIDILVLENPKELKRDYMITGSMRNAPTSRKKLKVTKI